MPRTEEEYKRSQPKSQGEGIGLVDIEPQPRGVTLPTGVDASDAVYHTTERHSQSLEPYPRDEPQLSEVITDLLSKHSRLRPPLTAKGLQMYDWVDSRGAQPRPSMKDQNDLMEAFQRLLQQNAEQGDFAF